MSYEARLETAASGLVPVTDGWFVVNVRDAAWLSNEAFGLRCVFEGGTPALRKNPDLDGHTFEQLGVTIAVLSPGRPSSGRGTFSIARPGPRTPSSARVTSRA